MTIGLVGRKCGMTRVFTEDGASTPVTVVEVQPNVVTQIKTSETDGYHALQVTTGRKSAKKVNKPLTGHYTKAEVAPGLGLWEFRVDEAQLVDVAKMLGFESVLVGSEITVKFFENIKVVDVSGVSKGKGFAGVIKRHNFSMQDATHGNSLSHRAPGSIGQNQTTGRVFKGKKMAGHMGNKTCTQQNLTVVRVDTDKNLLLIKGAIPGAINGVVIIKPAVKGGKANDS